jgi:hypothetical protein
VNVYYVYIHEKPDGTPFYVGKGKDGRAYSKDQRSPLWHEMANDEYSVHIVKDNMEQQAALDLEYFIINDFRKQFTLANKMARGWKNDTKRKPYVTRGVPKSEEHRRKLSEAKKGVPNLKLKGKKFSDEHKANLSAARKGVPNLKLRGRVYSEETLAKMSASRKGVPNPKMLGDLNPAKRPEVRAKMSASQKGLQAGEKNPMFGKSRPDLVERNKIKGKRYWTNGTINKFLLPTDTPPEGFWLGLTKFNLKKKQ